MVKNTKKSNSVHIATIDIGSNAVRMLVLHGRIDGGVESLSRELFIRMPVRLGRDAFAMSTIGDHTIENLCETMRGFATLMKIFDPELVQIVATSAMREATNREEVIARVYYETGLRIQCISGKAEAKYLEANFDSIASGKCVMFIDVGGGSTEFNLTKQGMTLAARSFKIGTLRKPEPEEYARQLDDIKLWLQENMPDSKDITYVASGGNINKLVALCSKDDTLSNTSLRKFVAKNGDKTHQELRQKFNLKPDRADVIIPAARIFDYIFETVGFDTLHVPALGLADAVARKLFLDYCDDLYQS